MIPRSSGVKMIDFSGPIKPTLFWHGKEEDVSAETLINHSGWNSVTSLRVHFDEASFSGQWYFNGLPEDEWYDSDSDVPLAPATPGLLPSGHGSEADTQAALALTKTGPLADENGHHIEGYDLRRIPRDETMGPLVEAFAHRLARMASLERARLAAHPLAHGTLVHCLRCAGPPVHPQLR